MAKSTKISPIIVKCAFINAPRIRCVANKDFHLASQDGLQLVYIRKNEVYYLVKSDSLKSENENETIYYVVVADHTTTTGWRCYCPSYKPCKHERGCMADNNNRWLAARQAATVSTEVAAPVVPAAPAARVVESTLVYSTPAALAHKQILTISHPVRPAKAEVVSGTLNGQRAFSILR